MGMLQEPDETVCLGNALALEEGASGVVPSRLSRKQLLRLGVASGGALVLSGSAGTFVQSAAGETVPDGDLAYLRLLVAAELLEANFHVRALASHKLKRATAAVVRKMAADDKAHYTALAGLLTAAGQTPATAGDIDFSYPKGSFRSDASIVRLGGEIEELVLGAYLGSIENVQTDGVRLVAGQIAANEAQHLGALAALGGRSVIGRAFAPALAISVVSAALDRFES